MPITASFYTSHILCKSGKDWNYMRNSPFRSIPSLHCRITSLAQRVGSLYVTEITENDEVKERPNEEIREIYVEDGRLSPII